MRSCLIIWYSSMTLFCYYHACPYVLLSMLTDLIYRFFLSIFFAWSDNRIFCNCRGMLMYVCTIMVSWRHHLTWGIMFRASTLCAYSKFTLANYLWHIVRFKLPISRSAHFCSFPLHHPLYYLTSNLDWQVPFPNKRPAYPSSFSIDQISVWVNIHDILPDHALYHHLCCFLLQVTLHHVLYQHKCDQPHPAECTPSSPSTGASPAFTMSPGYTTSTLLRTLAEGTPSSSPPTLPLPLPPPLLILQMLQTPRNLHLLALPEDTWGSNPCTFVGEIMFDSPEDQHGNHCIVSYLAVNSLASTRVLLTPFDGLGTGVSAPEECWSLVKRGTWSGSST